MWHCIRVLQVRRTCAYAVDVEAVACIRPNVVGGPNQKADANKQIFFFSDLLAFFLFVCLLVLLACFVTASSAAAAVFARAYKSLLRALPVP